MLKFSNADEVYEALYTFLIEGIDKNIAETGMCSLGISGGSSPVPLFEKLAKADISWKNIQVFWVDERYVSHDHPDSNFKSAFDSWLKYAPEIRYHPVDTGHENPQESARQYEQFLIKVLGSSPGDQPKPLDIVLLGMGTDGHTASLFPGSASLQLEKKSVVATENPYSGQKRISLNYHYIAGSKILLLPVIGSEKFSVLQKALRGENSFPIQYFLSENTNSIIFTTGSDDAG